MAKCIWTPHLHTPNSCHKVIRAHLSWMSLYGVEFIFSFTVSWQCPCTHSEVHCGKNSSGLSFILNHTKHLLDGLEHQVCPRPPHLTSISEITNPHSHVLGKPSQISGGYYKCKQAGRDQLLVTAPSFKIYIYVYGCCDQVSTYFWSSCVSTM